MSKIGEQPVQLKDGVEATVSTSAVEIKGPKGTLTIDIPKGVTVKKEDDTLVVTRDSDARKVRALHGLVRSLLSNAATGVVTPWEKRLEVVGTGYKVKMQGSDLVFDVGYSHSVTFKQLEGVTYAADKNTVIISGIDKQYVGEIAHKIRSIRRPDAYKGKGIRYEGEVLHLKPGKKAASTA